MANVLRHKSGEKTDYSIESVSRRDLELIRWGVDLLAGRVINRDAPMLDGRTNPDLEDIERLSAALSAEDD